MWVRTAVERVDPGEPGQPVRAQALHFSSRTLLQGFTIPPSLAVQRCAEMSLAPGAPGAPGVARSGTEGSCEGEDGGEEKGKAEKVCVCVPALITHTRTRVRWLATVAKG